MGKAAGTAAEELVEDVGRLSDLLSELSAGGTVENPSDRAVQRLLSVAVKLYVAKQESSDSDVAAFREGAVTQQEAILAATQMVRAVDLDLFELALWHGWGKI